MQGTCVGPEAVQV